MKKQIITAVIIVISLFAVGAAWQQEQEKKKITVNFLAPADEAKVFERLFPGTDVRPYQNEYNFAVKLEQPYYQKVAFGVAIMSNEPAAGVVDPQIRAQILREAKKRFALDIGDLIRPLGDRLGKNHLLMNFSFRLQKDPRPWSNERSPEFKIKLTFIIPD